MHRLPCVALFATLLAACSGSSPNTPSAPSNPGSSVPPITLTLDGRLTATNGGQPLAGIAARWQGQAATTDAGGSFTYRFSSTATDRLMFSGDGIVPRSLLVAVTQSRSVAADAIALTGEFDLAFYRKLVRDDLDTPGTLRPLQRWTRQPQIYIRTVDEAGRGIDTRTLDATRTALREAMPQFTDGAFTADITQGPETRQGAAGWLTVLWMSETGPGTCGQADVAMEGGTIDLFPRVASGNCGCGAFLIRPDIVKHELGHALGFWHTDSTSDVMSARRVGCNIGLSRREMYHAAIAYRRPNGNADPDSDPSTVVNVTQMKVR